MIAVGCRDHAAPAERGKTGATRTTIADAAVAPDAVAVAPPLRPDMPGSIWYLREGPTPALVRATSRDERVLRGQDGALYPSALRVDSDDGPALVAIASRGDGSADAEQLALVRLDAGPGAPYRLIGPRAPQVRDPTTLDRAVVAAVTLDGHSELVRTELHSGYRFLPLTKNPEGNFAPAAIPTTHELVFASSRDGNSEIYRIRSTGGRLRRLTAFHKDDWQPVPSPDGKSIAFLSDREGPARVFVMRPDGTGQRRLTARTESDDEGPPVWSPDGRSIAYIVRDRVVMRDVASGQERVVTPEDARDADPAFSPDGRWIAVSRVAGGDADIWAIPADGGAAVRISRDAAPDRLPRWLP